MWDEDWARLGIAPTTELAAIKKAYALKLRVTRPDDDAEAYQALRGAYERAQQWVKWQQPATTAEVPAAPVEPAPADLPPPAATSAPEVFSDTLPAAPEAPEAPEPPLDAGRLIRELELLWRRDGEAELTRHWSLVRHQLDQQPLSRQAQFSADFAQWVLKTPALPEVFLQAVNQHFGWLDDFRTERQLGAPLAHALHEALDARLRPVPLPEPVRELAGPLQALAALSEASGRGGRWRVAWLFFVLQPMLTRHRDILGADWLARLGLPTAWLDDCLKRGLGLRVAVAAVLCWGAGLLMLEDAAIATARVMFWLAGTSAFFAAGLTAGVFIGSGPTMTTPKGQVMRPLEAWRRHRSQPWLGLAWLLFAAWLANPAWSGGSGPAGSVLSLLSREAYQYAAWGFAIAGLLVAWPLDLLHGCVVLTLLPLAGYLFTAALGDWLPWPSCVLIGTAWMLAGAAMHEERFPVPPSSPARWLVRPVLNTLTLADRWSYITALAPLALCLAWAALTDGKVAPSRLFLVWVLGVLAVGWLQTKADALGLRLLQAWRPEPGG